MKNTNISVELDWEMKAVDDRSLVWELEQELPMKKLCKAIIRYSSDRKERREARSVLAELRG